MPERLKFFITAVVSFILPFIGKLNAIHMAYAVIMKLSGSVTDLELIITNALAAGVDPMWLGKC